MNYAYLNLPSVRLRAATCIVHSKKMKNRSAVLNDMMGPRLNQIILAEIIDADDEGLLHNIDVYDEDAAVTIGALWTLDGASDGVRSIFDSRFGSKK